MRSNKIMSILLVLAFVFSSIPIVGLADSSTATQPKFEVIGSTIKDDDKFFELTMKVTPGSKGFFSAGMTLQYDKSVITPVAWDTNGTVVPMSGCNDWQNVAAVPAICPDEISGKTALVYEEPKVTPEPGSTAAPTPTSTVTPTESPEATEEPEPVDDEPTTPTTEEPITPTTEEPVTPSTEEPTEVPTDAPSVEIDKDNCGYMYISAEAALPITAPLAPPTTVPTQTPEASVSPEPTQSAEPTQPPTDTPVRRKMREASVTPAPTYFPNNGEVITVRFMYVGDTADEIKASKTKVENGFATKDGEKIVRLAPDDISAESPAGQMVFYAAGDANDTEYYYTTKTNDVNNPSQGVTHDELLNEAPVFILEKDVNSRKQIGGGSDPSMFAALVFFDWDKTTLLGSMVVNGSSKAEDIINTINEYAKGLMAPDSAGNKPEMGADWASEKAKECTTYDTTPADDGKGYKYPLSSHDGYTFGKWIEFDSDAYTVYGEAVSLGDATSMLDMDVPADPDFSKVSGGLVLKAAYTANTKMDSDTVLNTAQLRRYTFTNEPIVKDNGTVEYDPNDGYFGRFGSSTNYSVKVKVTRVNESGQPVHRTRQTALKATYNLPGNVQSVSLINMEDVDEQIVEVAAPAAAESVTLAVIDIGGMDDWASGSASRSDAFKVESEVYVFQGNIIYMNDYPSTVDLDTNFTAPQLSDFTAIGLTLPATSLSARRKAVKDIATGQGQKLEREGKKYLTQSELQYAITHDGNYRDPSQ